MSAESIGQIANAAMPRVLATEHPLDWSGNSDLIRRVVTGLLLDAGERNEAQFHAHKRLCESPIECLALAGLIVLLPNAHVVEKPSLLKSEDWSIAIVPQMTSHGYRLDFGIIGRASKAIFDLECDGREYHKDKRRDADRAVNLWKHGIRAFHVSGSMLCRNTYDALLPLTQMVKASELAALV